jgi:predicted transcriptional regulator
MQPMTKLLQQAFETVSVLPEETQDELARVLLQLAGVDQPLVELTPEEDAALEESIAQSERGEFATDEEIRAIWAKHGL